MEANPARQHFTFDADLQLDDGHTSTTTVVGNVAGVAQVLDLGTARVHGTWIIDVSALDVVTGDEGYEFQLQGSEVANFASDFSDLALRKIGANAALIGDTDLLAGRYALPFTNVIGNKVYRYVRARLVPAGTTPSVTWSSWINKNPFGA